MENYKNEIQLKKDGLYVVLPINLNMLLTQNEIDVLNTIRHSLYFKKKYISISVFEIMTGLSENTIRKARDSLIDMELISCKKLKNNCMHYDVNYKKLYTIISELNQEKNLVERLRIADSYRGEKNSKNEKIIKKYSDSKFDI